MAAVFGGIFGFWGLFKAPSAYGYQGGTDVVATTSAGSLCETRYGSGGGTECPATWEVDGETVRGTLTSRYGGGEGIGIFAGTQEARAWGTTAATGYDEFDLWWGLNAWWMVAGAVVFVGVPVGVQKWREPREVRRALAAGDSIAFGPVDLSDQGLRFGQVVVGWSRVGAVTVEKIGRQRVGVNRYTVPTTQVSVLVDDEIIAMPRGAVPSPSLFEALVRERVQRDREATIQAWRAGEGQR